MIASRSHLRAALCFALPLILITTDLPAQAPPADAPAAAKAVRRPFARPGTPRRLEHLRTFDVIHTRGELVLDVDQAEIRGTVTHTLKPLRADFAVLNLDCGEALNVAKVVAGPKAANCGIERKGEVLTITLDRPYGLDETLDVAITYAGSPRHGLYFVKPDSAHPDRAPAIWTQGEAEETHHWLPCYDYPNDRATSEMIVTVAKPLIVVSNGALLDTRENGDGTRTFQWKIDVPHVSYLISLAAADFRVYHDKAGPLPVDYYAPKSYDEATVRRTVGKTPAMIAFFNEKIGVAYPYAKYAQVFVPDFMSGGMENISATTLTESALLDAIAARERDADGLVAHELAHQWFGDLLTCRDWSHTWLNEGFASYFAALFAERDKGDDGFRLEMARNLENYVMSDRGYRRPIVETRYDRPLRMFDGVTYAKGSLVLHALRGAIGDDAWWDGICRYVRANREHVVTTDDFRKAMEAASGKDLAWFFDQWTTRGGHPELKVRWRYEKDDQTARIAVEQTQKVDELTPLFRLPTTIELGDDSGTRSVPVVIDGTRHEFVIPSPCEPKMVRLDPRGWIPKEIDFEKAPAQWIYQLAHASDVLGRVEAARALGKRKEDADAARALAAAWPLEKERTARAEIVSALAAVGEACRSALVEAAKDPEAPVRVKAYEGLAALKKDDAAEALFRAALSDRDAPYGVRRAALGALVAWKVKDKDELIAAALNTPSHNDVIAAAGVGHLLRDDGLSTRENAVLYSAYGRPRTVRFAALAALGRLAKDDPALQDLLIALIDDPERLVRTQAVSTLSRLGVKRALSAMEARVAKEDQFSLLMMDEAIARLKDGGGGSAGAGAAPGNPSAEAADLERRAASLELEAKELRNRAEALRLKAERAKLPAPAAE
jgi:aminopeptidase N